MAQGNYTYRLVYLPDVNPTSFLLFVYNSRGWTNLRDYSSGVETVLKSEKWSVAEVEAATKLGATRVPCDPHRAEDVDYWRSRISERNAIHFGESERAATVALGVGGSDAGARSRGDTTQPPTPLTEMLELYRSLAKTTLTSRVALARETTGAALARKFKTSVERFSTYGNVEQTFHGAPTAFQDGHGATLTRTVDLAQRLALEERIATDRTWDIAERPELSFRYVDRELDCLRRTPGRRLDDGTAAKRAVVLDLLLENTRDGTPILAELKIRQDKDAFFGLLQLLTAAAHLVTAPQRARLANVYELTFPPRGPFVDLYVILFEPFHAGVRTELLRESRRIARELANDADFAAVVRRIEFVEASEGADGRLRFVAT
jgi:hypothetical protein